MKQDEAYVHSMIEHYRGQEFISARLSLEENEIDSAEESRRKLIENLGTLESNEGLKNYIQFLKGSRWDSLEKIDEADAKSEELVTK